MATYNNFPGRESLLMAGDEGPMGFEFAQICHIWASSVRTQPIVFAPLAQSLTGNAEEDVQTTKK